MDRIPKWLVPKSSYNEIYERYINGENLQQVGDAFNVTRETVRQIVREKLRKDGKLLTGEINDKGQKIVGRGIVVTEEEYEFIKKYFNKEFKLYRF